MIDSCEIMFSVNERSKTIEMKFVAHGTFLQNKNHTYHMSEAEYFNYRKIGGSLSINDTQPARVRSDFKQALSTLKRLHQEAGGDQLEPIPYCKYNQWKPASSSSSSGTGKNPGGLPKKFKESQERRGKQRLVIERGNPLFTELWRKPQTNGFQEFILFCHREIVYR